ncbi:alpha/beta hydrolase [Massilia sp. W12]|uniref:alpha/beta hydrolase n=1 Tax=Massilia sp. W12 TaxID=3126507 RepID=UPI0030D1A1DD
MKTFPFLTRAAGLLGLLLAGAAHAAGALPGKSCHLFGYESPLRCMTVAAPLDYAQPARGTVNLHVTIAPAWRENSKNDPLFVLAGGPGQSGSSIVYLLENGMQRVRSTRDIVFIDQRGTGKSGKLSCPELQRSETMHPDQVEAEVQTCFKSLRADLSQYSTPNAARDLDQVRKALKVQQINLWGGSYGTRLAQVYAAMFPAHTRSMVLDGVVSPQQNVGMLGLESGRAMQLLRDKCTADAACSKQFPQFTQQLDSLLEQARKGASIRFQHPLTGKEVSMPLREENLSASLRMMLYAPQNAARIPYLVQQAAQGNWQPLAAATISFPSWEQDGMALGLTMAVLCGEDVAFIDEKQVLAERGRSFIGDTWTRQMQRWCQVLKVGARAPNAPHKLDTPTLLLSGRYDPVTPPERAEEAMRYLSRAQHLIAPEVGHIVTPHGCAMRLLRLFLDEPGKPLDGKCLNEIAREPFVLSPAGAEP